MLMAQHVDELARKTPGKKSIAIEAFGSALRAIPSIISDNAGLDSADLVSKLRAAHFSNDSRAGIDVITGAVSIFTCFACQLEIAKTPTPTRKEWCGVCFDAVGFYCTELTNCVKEG